MSVWKGWLIVRECVLGGGGGVWGVCVLEERAPELLFPK